MREHPKHKIAREIAERYFPFDGFTAGSLTAAIFEALTADQKRPRPKFLTRAEVSVKLAQYYSEKFHGTVTAEYDASKRAYCIHGSGLPAADEMKDRYPNGWELLDYIEPRTARVYASLVK